jgi:hypothetical protein
MITETTIVTAPDILGSEILDIDTVIFDTVLQWLLQGQKLGA